MVITVNTDTPWERQQQRWKQQICVTAHTSGQREETPAGRECPSPSPALGSLRPSYGQSPFQSLFLSRCKTIYNSTPEEISVFLFHKLLSQSAASRAHCHFLHFTTAGLLRFYFILATLAQSFSLFLCPPPTTPAQRNVMTFCTKAGQPHRLSPLPTASLSLTISARAQIHKYTHKVPPLCTKGQASSSSRTAILLQLSPCLQKGPNPRAFSCIFKPSRCPCLNSSWTRGAPLQVSRAPEARLRTRFGQRAINLWSELLLQT